jgi:hypothetical protein
MAFRLHLRLHLSQNKKRLSMGLPNSRRFLLLIDRVLTGGVIGGVVALLPDQVSCVRRYIITSTRVTVIRIGFSRREKFVALSIDDELMFLVKVVRDIL